MSEINPKKYNVIWVEQHNITVMAEDEGDAIRKAMKNDYVSCDNIITEQPYVVKEGEVGEENNY